MRRPSLSRSLGTACAPLIYCYCSNVTDRPPYSGRARVGRTTGFPARQKGQTKVTATESRQYRLASRGERSPFYPYLVAVTLTFPFPWGERDLQAGQTAKVAGGVQGRLQSYRPPRAGGVAWGTGGVGRFSFPLFLRRRLGRGIMGRGPAGESRWQSRSSNST